MTIDEKADKAAIQFITDYTKIEIDSPPYRALVVAFKSIARDQRHACADAAMAVFSAFPTVGDGQYADSGRINQAIINA